MNIPFNEPYMTGKELGNVAQADANGHLVGDGSFRKRCSAWLELWPGSEEHMPHLTAEVIDAVG